MELHFLGTTGYHPNNTRQTACLMIPEMGVCLDAGTGMFRVRDLLQTPTLDILLTHVHLDHSIGLTFLYDILFQREMQRVTVHCAAEKIEVIEKHLYNKQLFPVEPNFEFQAFADDQIRLSDDCLVSLFPLDHPGGSHGFRFDWSQPEKRSLAYITDTTAIEDADYVEKITGVDTLIHECNFPDGWEDRAKLTGHSCLTPVAKVAKKAGVKRLILCHLNPLIETDPPLDLKSVQSIYSEITIAQDRMVIDI